MTVTAATADAGIAPSASRTRREVTGACPGLAFRKSHYGLSKSDLDTAWVDGNDLLAVVNRAPTGSLAPEYVPPDLVEIATKKPAASEKRCEQVQCLRREAAAALDELLAAMRGQGFPGHVESAYRGYRTQCFTFQSWVQKSDFCRAAEQSAMPGHSQHQLGTTVDLFTEAWARDARGVFRDGFGCTPGGKWLAAHATEYGFVMSYPLHPEDASLKDDCAARTDAPVGVNPLTGYRYERWHFRYIGKDAAQRFVAFRDGARAKSGATLEQFLRAEKGLTARDGADAELPVCDGCNCHACASLAPHGEGACESARLDLDVHGDVVASAAAPTLTGVQVRHNAASDTVIAHVHAEASVPTQSGSAAAGAAETYRIALRPRGRGDAGAAGAFTQLASLADTHAALFERAAIVLPSRSGDFDVKLSVPSASGAVQSASYDVAIVRGGEVVGAVLEAR